MTDVIPIRPPRVYSDGLLDLARSAVTTPMAFPVGMVTLGQAVLDLVADLDGERQRHQVAVNQREDAMRLVEDASAVMAKLREHSVQLGDALRRANCDVIAGVQRERQQDAVIAELQAKLEAAEERERRLVQAGADDAFREIDRAVPAGFVTTVEALVSALVSAHRARQQCAQLERIWTPRDDGTCAVCGCYRGQHEIGDACRAPDLAAAIAPRFHPSRHAFERATEAITGRSYAEVSADLDQQMAAHPVADADPGAFEDPLPPAGRAFDGDDR